MARRMAKFFGWTAGIVAIGVAAFFSFQYLQYRGSDEYQAEQFVKNWERQYAEDTYGGDTPEETLRLFVSALKAGDTDLAAKYFVIDKQQEWRDDLAKIKEKNLLGEMIRDLERLNNKYPLVEGENTRFIFEVYNEQKELVLQADIAKGPSSKWKIIKL